ncbi:glycoside hydrolase family 43 protein [Sphingomonas citri]
MRRVIGRLGTGAATLLAVIGAAASAQVARFERFTYQGRTQEQAPLSAGQYRNPILSGYYPDPSVTRVGDDYYLVNSSFAHFPGLPVFHSKNLVDWTQIGNAIDRPDQLDFTGRRVSEAVFAPDISYHDGVFYIANTCVSCGGNFVTTARDPAGPWSKPIWLPFEGIDPSIFWEGDRAYIVNNRAPNEAPRYDGHRALWVQEYDWRAGKMVGESTQLVNGGVDLATKPVWIEGPHLLRKDGFYYLTAAEGGTGDNHSQVVFRSRALRGPFIPYAGNPILTQRDLPANRAHPVTSAGHAKLVKTQNGDWWATFLATRPHADGHYNIGRETFLLPVTWRGGWPHILERGRAIPFTAARPRLPASPAPTLPTSGDFGYVDEFDGATLGLQWIGIRTPRQPFYRLDGGALELSAAARFGDLSGTPAFLGRRHQHHVATVSTVLRFAPERDGARAGLAAVQNDRSLLKFAVTRLGGKTMVALYKRDLADSDTLVASAPVDPGSGVTLTIRADGGTMAFDYATRGARRTLTDRLDTTFLSTQRAGGFVGTVIGPFVEAP